MTKKSQRRSGTIPDASSRIHIYGPVPSRRLGFSLGVDILPFKTCSLDCVYCQLGPTAEKKSSRAAFFSSREVLPQIREAIRSGRRIDTITFSGSGEPTLNRLIGDLIADIKASTDIPVTVLTNSTLMTDPAVRKALLPADRVVPSLDAARQDIFERVNQPASDLKISDIIDGLVTFRKEFSGLIWLEILLVKGINDSEGHLQSLKAAVRRIRPDRIQLNTVVRPPSDRSAQPLTRERMENVRSFFGEKAEIIADMAKAGQKPVVTNLPNQILAVIHRRPVTREDLSNSLGLDVSDIQTCLDDLLTAKVIQTVRQGGLIFYKPA
jgi:wyosine [tRNA(Phe)-imidazoG37] synthetase (radical SAM superfamily)